MIKSLITALLAVCSLCITLSVLFFVGKIGPKVNEIGQTEPAVLMSEAKQKLTDSLQSALGYIFKPKDNNYEKAFKSSRIVAVRKDPQALFNLAYMYENGKFIFADRFKAMNYYQEAADLGYAPAQVNLGNIYSKHKKYGEAFKMYKAAINQGNGIAQYNLALMYYNGEGMDKDINKAIELFEQSAEKGIIWGDYALGCIFYDMGEYKKALEHYLKVGEIAPAAHKIGNIYYEGLGTEKNEAKGMEYFTQAGNAGYVNSQMKLGGIYKEKKDYAQAFKWFLKAADLGAAQAALEVGTAYSKTEDFDKKEKYYALAAAYQKAGVQPDDKKAFHYNLKAAERGNAEAQFRVGEAYFYGEGVAQDYKKAAEWYYKAAMQGDASAQNNLAVMYKKGQGVAKDYKKAFEWIYKAAMQGDASAQNNLGFMYYNGQGVAKNYQQALQWYKKAAAQGNANAQRMVSSYPNW